MDKDCEGIFADCKKAGKAYELTTRRLEPAAKAKDQKAMLAVLEALIKETPVLEKVCFIKGDCKADFDKVAELA